MKHCNRVALIKHPWLVLNKTFAYNCDGIDSAVTLSLQHVLQHPLISSLSNRCLPLIMNMQLGRVLAIGFLAMCSTALMADC